MCLNSRISNQKGSTGSSVRCQCVVHGFVRERRLCSARRINTYRRFCQKEMKNNLFCSDRESWGDKVLGNSYRENSDRPDRWTPTAYKNGEMRRWRDSEGRLRYTAACARRKPFRETKGGQNRTGRVTYLRFERGVCGDHALRIVSPFGGFELSCPDDDGVRHSGRFWISSATVKIGRQATGKDRAKHEAHATNNIAVAAELLRGFFFFFVVVY